MSYGKGLPNYDAETQERMLREESLRLNAQFVGMTDQEYIAALEELLTRGAMAGYKVETEYESGREYGAIYANDCRCCALCIAKDDPDEAAKPSTLRELVEVCRRRGLLRGQG